MGDTGGESRVAFAVAALTRLRTVVNAGNTNQARLTLLHMESAVTI
jgi:hypothetical protein